MFNRDFYPTPLAVIETMCQDLTIPGKVFLEPSAGTGEIVKYLQRNGAKEVIACEKNDQLRSIVAPLCRVIESDFLKVESHQISHIDAIVMNPPFTSDERHIIHAFNIAPPGCKIVALCNFETLKKYNSYSSRRELKQIIDENGYYINLGNVFSEADRETDVEIGMVCINKPGVNNTNEFEGFFLEDEPTENMEGVSGIMPYNSIRDLVNRYIAAIKIYDQQLETAAQLNDLTKDYFFIKQPELAISVTRLSVPLQRNQFKKEMQKAGWLWVFEKMKMEKYSTKTLKEEMNKFVEQQTNIPFTMKNIYRMLDIVIGTHSGRMDKALLEVFEKLTKHYDDNRYCVEGWKTNSHYLVNQRFILPWIVTTSYSGNMEVRHYDSNSNAEIIQDMIKALCYITGSDYNKFHTLSSFVQYKYKLKNKTTGEYLQGYDNNSSDLEKMERRKKDFYEEGKDIEIEQSQVEWGKWFDWAFFRVKAYKKGTMHFEFNDLELWGKFNQHISRIKGYPLFEAKEQTAWQKRQNKSTKQAA